MVSPVRFSVPQPVKTVIVPALGVGAVFADMERRKKDRDKAIRLGETLTAIASCVCLYRWQAGLLTLVGGIAMWVRTKSKETKGEKAKSVAQDLIWVGSGLAALKYLSGKVNQAGERQWYLHNCCAFAIGALVAAPLINRLIFGKESNKKEDSLEANSNKFSITDDKYGILTNIIRPHRNQNVNNQPSDY